MPVEQRAGEEKGLRHQLSAAQMAMVGVGGSIGTGLLLGSGAAIEIAGPALILTYVAGAFLAWTVTNALGELASAHPGAGSFGLYAELYLNDWAGFVARYGYWFAIAAAVGGELVAAATYSQYWFPHVPALVWIVVYSALLLAINLRPVGDYGSFEFWFAMVKVVTIVVFVLAGAFLLVGGRATPQYLKNGGFFPTGAVSPLLAVSFALFSFLGIEMVSISSGEARETRAIARATKIMFAMLTFLYVGATVVLVGFLPWNRAGVTQSPFVSVFVVAGIPAASTVMNFVVLTAALSGANANMYACSRMMFSLARSGHAPPALGRLNAAGSPQLALLLSGIGVPMALMAEHWAPRSAFLWLIGCSLAGGMLAWCVGLAAHIAFRRRLTAAEVAALPMRAPGGAVFSAIGLAGILLAVASTWWVPQSRITIVSGLPYLALLSLGWLLMRNRWRPREKSEGTDLHDA